jgi:hypothetical protein
MRDARRDEAPGIFLHRHRISAAVVAAFAVCAMLPARAGNLALVSGSYGATLGAGGATAAERCAFGQNPAALRPGSAGVHFDFNRPYGLDDVAMAEAGGFLDAAQWGMAAGWRQTGVDGLYDEQGFQLTQTLRLGGGRKGFPGTLDLGASWEAWRARWPDGSADLAWSHGLGLGWRMLPRLKAGAFVLGLPLGGGRGGGNPGPERILQWGMEADSRDPDTDGPETVRRRPIQAVRLDFRKTGDSPWRTLASLSLSPVPAVEITGGFAVPPFQASLGARVSWSAWSWHQAYRYHRFLGRTWLSGLAYSRALGPAPRN